MGLIRRLSKLRPKYISTYMIRDQKVGLGTLLRQLVGQLDGDVQAHYSAAGLAFRPKFYPIFQHLLRAGSASVGEIAIAMRASQPAATQTINELKDLGLVSGDAGEDRRERRIVLTEEGSRIADALRPYWRAVERAVETLDDELPYGLRSTLESALAALERRGFADRIGDALTEEKRHGP
jgi:DNA-binding MarR family transcriptional regulator